MARAPLSVLAVTLVLSAWISATVGDPTNYHVGVGIADITGPAAEVNMMGYANPAQTTSGIHLRQFSRTFIFQDANMENTVVFINIDACMFSVGMKLEIIKRLQTKYGDKFSESNVCISGTHTHSGPAGFHQYILYDITSLGFVKETFDSLVDGIIMSVDQAHSNIKPANLFINSGQLVGSNINRSPSAYLFNPKEERDQYEYNTDTEMTVLKIVDADNKPMGMINWFPVHCTSMNNTNHLISSDNKGYASLLFEAEMNGPGTLPGKGSFVAAFGQANEGDVSPNTKGPHCLDTGLPCDTNTSTCNGRNEMCVASGPGRDMFESTQIIGSNQYKKAKELFDGAITQVNGPVDFRHTYTDMTQQTVGEGKKTCKPAMGYSFAAGTTDGPGAFDFTQGSNSSSPFWNFVSGLLKKPTPEQVECQKPKPILLDTGEIDTPYAWEPAIVGTQVFRIGQLVIIAVPAEFTTMSGRRLRNAVSEALVKAGMTDKPVPVIAGLSNDYADYVTTFEEYQDQRYEGGSNIYGPHALQAYIQVFQNLSTALAKAEPVSPGPTPPNLISKQLSFLPPVVVDFAPFGHNFGDVIQEPTASYRPGQRVGVIFIGANPRNDRKAESTFLEVLKKQENGSWTVQYNDAHWETRFAWKSVSFYGESDITITWDIPTTQAGGTYKIRYYGNNRSISGSISAFTGETRSFSVVNKADKLAKYLRKKTKLSQQNTIKGREPQWLNSILNNA